MRNQALHLTLASFVALLSVIVAALQSQSKGNSDGSSHSTSTRYRETQRKRQPGCGVDGRLIPRSSQRLRFRNPDLSFERCPVKRPGRRHEPAAAGTNATNGTDTSTASASASASASAVSPAASDSTVPEPLPGSLGSGSNASAPPVLTFNLSSTATLNLTPYLPAHLTSDGSTIPVLLDTLSPCSWLATLDMVCFDSYSPAAVSGNSSADANATATGERCVKDVYGELDGTVAGVDPSTLRDLTSESQQVGRCSHYLAGTVEGPVVEVPLQMKGALLSLDDESAGAGEVLEETRINVSVGFLLAETFSASGGNGFGDFQRYYGGGSGVLGLADSGGVAVGSQPAVSADVTREGESMSDTTASVLGGGEDVFSAQSFLASIFNSWSWQYSASNRTFGLALPRDGEVGKFVVGAPIREVLDREGTADLTVIDGGVLSMSPPPPNSPVLARAARSWNGSYSIPSVRITVDGIDFGGSPAKLRSIQHEEQSLVAERYHIDTALPIIWTSASMASQIASLFDPPGWLEMPSMPSAANTTNGIPIPLNSTNHPVSANWTYPTTWSNRSSTTSSSSSSSLRPKPLYRVPCNATPPNITLHLSSYSTTNTSTGSREIAVPLFPPDTIVRLRLREGWECMSAFQDGDFGVPSSASVHLSDDPADDGEPGKVVKMRRLGWPFLRNVLLDFDLGYGTAAGAGGRVGVGVRGWPEEDGWSEGKANQTHGDASAQHGSVQTGQSTNTGMVVTTVFVTEGKTEGASSASSSLSLSGASDMTLSFPTTSALHG